MTKLEVKALGSLPHPPPLHFMPYLCQPTWPTYWLPPDRPEALLSLGLVSPLPQIRVPVLSFHSCLPPKSGSLLIFHFMFPDCLWFKLGQFYICCPHFSPPLLCQDLLLVVCSREWGGTCQQVYSGSEFHPRGSPGGSGNTEWGHLIQME